MPTPPSLLLVLQLAVGVTSPSPACNAPCNGFTCGDYAALRVNCSTTLYMGCACKGCCADGTITSTKDAKGLVPALQQPSELLDAVCASHLHHRRALEETNCLVPQLDLSGLVPSVDLSSVPHDIANSLIGFDLTELFEADGGLIAAVAPVLRGPGDWLLDVAVKAFRAATDLKHYSLMVIHT